MARWRGIFGRKGKREGEPGAAPTASTDAPDDPVTALYPSTPARAETSGTEPTVDPFDPDTGTAEWEAPSPVSGRRRLVVDDGGPSDQPAERIQAAADEAAQVAEIRSHDEIAALERDLVQTQANASAEIDELAARLREAEARASRAEEESNRLAEDRDQVEAQAREAATQWLRQQVTKLKADAQQRVREEVERLRAEQQGVDPGGDETGVDRSADAQRREMEERALAVSEAKTAERIARMEADAEERIRAEVSVARRAAEERFAEMLGRREEELQAERDAKAVAIEQSQDRLTQIESQAIEAAQRVSVAEQGLEEEKQRLQEEAAAQLVIATEQAQALAAKDAEERNRDREEQLNDSIAAASRAEEQVESKVREAEERATAAEERARSIELEAAATISEVRQAAADWLRAQTGSIRAEAGREARSGASKG